MAFKYLRHTAFVAILLQLTAAQQQSKIVPQDLQGGFSSSDTAVQVSYTNQAVDGFADGTSFSKDAVAKEPTFALGDSAGISPTTLYTIIMLDTTCSDKRILHYARANFKNNLDITNIDTKSAPLFEYKAPGSLGETGDNRQYSFLMYLNPQRKQIDQLQLPAQGEAFDAKKFQTDNGLSDPTAGVGMVVKLGGQANCDGAQPSVAPSNLQSAKPIPSSSANAGPASSAAASTSPAIVPSSRAQVTSASTIRPQRPSSAANASPTSSSSPGNDTPDNTNNNGNNNAPVPSDGRPSGRISASSVIQSDGLATSTIVPGGGSPNSGADGAGASRTPSASLVQQSANAAPGTSTAEGYGLLASLFAVAGLLMW